MESVAATQTGPWRPHLLDVDIRETGYVTMAHTNPPHILAIRKPGWIEVGNSRAFLMDSLGGLFSYREQLAQEVGIEAEAEICQRSGYASAERLIGSLLQSGSLTADESGFRTGVGLFGMGGYGNFEVDEVLFDDGWAKITATDSIEGWMFHQHGTRHGMSCDYARGFFSALMCMMRQANGEDLTGLDMDDADPITCIETGCVAAGDEVCTFVVGLTSELLTKGFQPSTVVQSSIRETLLRLNRQLEHILDHSRKDHLTNLYNRSFFEAALRQRIGFAKRRSDVVSLAVIDVDHFKQVNDTHGHGVGDRVLRQLAYILENQARENDIVARLGGDEFVWLMPATGPDSAASVVRRIAGSLESMRDEIGFAMTVSIGVAGYPRDASSPSELIEAADNALYVAKEEGRNQVVVCGTDPASRATRPTPPYTIPDQPPKRAAASVVPPLAPAPVAVSHDPVATRRVKSRLRSARNGRGR